MIEPIAPDYLGASVAGLVPALIGAQPGGWLPSCLSGAETVVLLVLDGVGWRALEEHRPPVLSALEGGPITTVVPSTTAAALTSIVTGTPPARHGIMGYRMRVGGQVLDVLRWRVPDGRPPAPETLASVPAFLGRPVPVVTRGEFARTGFTEVHMNGAKFVGWRTTATLVEQVRRLVAAGERLVYAYYDGVDKVAHEYGLEDGFFASELAATDRLVGDLLEVLPEQAALAVTSDHGQTQFREWVELTPLHRMVAAYAGDARFRYLHARPGSAEALLNATEEHCRDRAWVLSRDRLVDEGWLGPETPSGPVLTRVGDVTLAARGSVAFVDPTHLQETRLVAGHGSLTAEEMLVPLVAGRGRG